MAQYHFVEDYERLVADYMARYPLDEAMSRLVGSDPSTFSLIGDIERKLLVYAGLQPGMSVVDLGCGSGRLAQSLGQNIAIEYTGLDIIQPFLDYAKRISPANYRFLLNRTLTLPVKDQSADFVSAFSVFTHLLHAESYLYMTEARRALRPGGRLVCSFLEFASPTHWPAFEAEVAGRSKGQVPHLNIMIERNVITLWAEKLQFKLIEIIACDAAPWGGAPLGQSVAILEKSA